MQGPSNEPGRRSRPTLNDMSASLRESCSIVTTPPHRECVASLEADIRVELRRGPVAMIITWPASAATDFTARTRELLR